MKHSTLNAAVSTKGTTTTINTNTFAAEVAAEAQSLAGNAENPAARVLPAALTSVLKAAGTVDAIWHTYTTQAHTAGLRLSMLVGGGQYLKGATPEYNLVYETVARAKFGDNPVALMGHKEAIKANLEDRRDAQIAAIGPRIGDIRKHLAKFEKEAAVAAGQAPAEGEDGAGTKKGADTAPRGKMIDPAIVLNVVEAILEQKGASPRLLAAAKVLGDKLTDWGFTPKQ